MDYTCTCTCARAARVAAPCPPAVEALNGIQPWRLASTVTTVTIIRTHMASKACTMPPVCMRLHTRLNRSESTPGTRYRRTIALQPAAATVASAQWVAGSGTGSHRSTDRGAPATCVRRVDRPNITVCERQEHRQDEIQRRYGEYSASNVRRGVARGETQNTICRTWPAGFGDFLRDMEPTSPHFPLVGRSRLFLFD